MPSIGNVHLFDSFPKSTSWTLMLTKLLNRQQPIVIYNFNLYWKMGTIYIFLSALVWNCFLCWDWWNSDTTATLDAALLCSSRAGSNLGCKSGLGWGALSIGFPHSLILLFYLTHTIFQYPFLYLVFIELRINSFKI